MCTSFVHNGNNTLVGWNLDILDMKYRVVPSLQDVRIEILDDQQWLPLFGVNCRGDFIGMPTCWPYDSASDPKPGSVDIIHVDIDLLLCKRTFEQTVALVQEQSICSIPGTTFQAQLSNRMGDVLQVTPGQGVRYLKKPKYAVMTNFSPFTGAAQQHPWMGLNRYEIADRMLNEADADMGVQDCMHILQATSQTVCPTVVSMVYDAGANMVYWCTGRSWDNIHTQQLQEDPHGL